MKISIQEKSLVILVGASCSGKSTFCQIYFDECDIIEPDHFRVFVGGSETDQSNNTEVFKHVYDIIDYRLSKGIFTVLDATNLKHEFRAQLIDIAAKNNVQITAIAFDVPEEEILKRRREEISPGVIKRHCKEFSRTMNFLKKDIKNTYVLRNPELRTESCNIQYDDGEDESFEYEILYCNNEKVDVEIVPLSPNEHIEEVGYSYDLIGDVHGCAKELHELLDELSESKSDNHKFVFVGDLVDRGPNSIDVLMTVMNLCKGNRAHCVIGNHDDKFLRAINHNKVQINPVLQRTLDDYYSLPDKYQNEIKEFLESLPHHLVLDDGRLVVSHAGIKSNYIGKDSKRIKEFCLYGDVDNTFDDDGFPVRNNWARDYRGNTTIVYGHTPHSEMVSENNTYNIDTGCVFGGKLTALRYPSMEVVQVQATDVYANRTKKTLTDGFELQAYIPDISDYNKDIRYIDQYVFPGSPINLPKDNMRAVLKNTTYQVDPRWLVYVPPTMSPCETSALDDYLEHPIEAINYYRSNGIKNVICERKHMGSRAVVIVCKDNNTAKRVFHITNDKEFGIIYTRTGKRFFYEDLELEEELLTRLRDQLVRKGFFTDLNSDWIILDCELLPWSRKAQGLITRHYAPVGRIGHDNLSSAIELFDLAVKNNYQDNDEAKKSLEQLSDKFTQRLDDIDKYTVSYRNYCKHVKSVDDITIAPFHVLAYTNHLNVSEDSKHIDHLRLIEKYIVDDKNFIRTPYLEVNVDDENDIQKAVDWWLEATSAGYEGMVVKPDTYISKSENGRVLQPAIKCRGSEYLRIIYGPEYTSHLDRLKKRSLSSKRNLAWAEFILGINSLYNFVYNKPFYKIHQASLGVLAHETVPVDVRL